MIQANIKEQLYNFCEEYVKQRLYTVQQAIDAVKAAANDETKSSAGDKYETGRAMAQLEQEKNLNQLYEAQYLKNDFLKIDPLQKSKAIASGSLVITDKGNFYISISAGKIVLENEIYYAISNSSPIAKEFFGKSENQTVIFNGLKYLIIKVY